MYMRIKSITVPPNLLFMALNNFKDGIMRKDEKNTKLTELEINHNKKISKVRYIIEKYNVR